MIIAIDGPVAAGKSTIAKKLAQKLGYYYLDTGAMYRALTWLALKKRVPLSSEEKLAKLAKDTKIFFSKAGQILVDNFEVTLAIRSPRVERFVSLVAKVPKIRKILVEKQRRLVRKKNAVVEGRDMGTVVFPEASLKIFLTAKVSERIKRKGGESVTIRDKIDSTRKSSPLLKAPEAHLIDTSGKSVAQVVAEILELYHQKNQ